MDRIVLAAVLLDIIIGDPRWMPHPVRAMGWVVTRGESLVRSFCQSAAGLKWGGIVLVIAVVGGSYIFFWGLIKAAYEINPILGLLLSIFVVSQSLAINSLYRHARDVQRPLKAGNLGEARQALAMIVGRDTNNLNEIDLVRGTVETIAENTVDGITSPLFYALLGGPPLAMAYKAVNTLDSMIGYKNYKYRDLGWAAARLDDLANYLPARITALFYILAAPFTPGKLGGVLGAMWRDSSRHPSPNSGIPEAAVAGALQVQLGGSNYYGGIFLPRPLIGRPGRNLESRHISQSLGIMAAVSAQALLAGILIYRLLVYSHA